MDDPRRRSFDRENLDWWLRLVLDGGCAFPRLALLVLGAFWSVLAQASFAMICSTGILTVLVVALVLYLVPKTWQDDRPRDRAVALSPASEPKRIRLVAKQADVVCPFCKDAVDIAISHVVCEKCDTRHHPSCFRDNGKCAVHGCGETLPRIIRIERTG